MFLADYFCLVLRTGTVPPTTSTAPVPTLLRLLRLLHITSHLLSGERVVRCDQLSQSNHDKTMQWPDWGLPTAQLQNKRNILHQRGLWEVKGGKSGLVRFIFWSEGSKHPVWTTLRIWLWNVAIKIFISPGMVVSTQHSYTLLLHYWRNIAYLYSTIISAVILFSTYYSARGQNITCF